MKITDAEFTRLVDYMYKKFGINLKQKRVLIEGRLSLMLTQRGYKDYNSYINDVIKDTTGQEVSLIVSKLTTNFTYFLREEGHYDFMVKNILPAWKTNPPASELKIWSAASSSGEEPYSIAMVVSNYFGFSMPVRVSIQASDISDHVLKQAKAGVYNKERTSKLPKGWVSRFFKKNKEDEYEVNDAIKSMVNYRYFNLNDVAQQWPARQYDILFCRNVMIYFDQPTKQALCKRLFDALKPGGYLFIGMSETLVNLQTDFTYIQPSIYQRKP